MSRPPGTSPDGVGGDGHLTLGDLDIDIRGREVYVDSQPVALTRTQFDLLVALASAPGRVMRRDDLMEQVWGHTFFADPDHLSVHIHHIRRALGDSADPPRFIQTVRGVGYKFIAPRESQPRMVILDFDADSVLLAVTPHEPFLGWHPDDIVGDYFSMAGLDAAASREVVKHMANTGGVAGPLPVLDGDGHSRTVPMVVTIHQQDGVVTGYRGIITLPD